MAINQLKTPPTDSLFNEALQHHQSGRLNEAETLYRQILSIEPHHADSIHLLGVIASQVGQNELAINMISEALKLNPSALPYHNNLGKILKELGRYEEAEKHLTHAVNLQPNYVDALNNLGTVYFAQRKYDHAKQQFEKTIALQPDYPDSYNNIGGIYLFRGDIENAIKYYKKAHTLKPGCSETFYNLLLVEFHKTPVQDWGPICQRALEYAPLSDMHKFDALVRQAIHSWTIDDKENLIQALKQSQHFPWATASVPDKNLSNTQAYRNILLGLISYYTEHPFHRQTPADKIALIGDSHTMSYVNSTITLQNVVYDTVPHLVMGCKAWHLARSTPDLHSWSFTNTLACLTPRSKAIVSIGEIDCRHNEGIIGHYKKHGGNLDEITAITAHNFVHKVIQLAKARNIEPIFINVPAPYIGELRRRDPNFTDQDEKGLIQVISLFNSTLSKEALSLNSSVIDVYGYTVGEGGTAQGEHHLDGYHLKPYVLGNSNIIRP